jgi:hypothetical protein
VKIRVIRGSNVFANLGFFVAKVFSNSSESAIKNNPVPGAFEVCSLPFTAN